MQLAIEQLDAFEAVARQELAVLQAPPVGDQAARRRETRRRASIPHLPRYVKDSIHQISYVRAALSACPESARAVYHALMVGMLSQYPFTEQAREVRQAKREAAVETNFRRKSLRPPAAQNKSAGR